MNFQQLKIIREAARQDYNLTEVANMLFTSQSGVSRHIRELEDELGIEIFVRRGKRLLGMTEPGKALMNPLMILVKIIKLRWIHILSYDQMVSRKINNQTTRCANSIFYTTLFTNSAPNYT